MKGPTGCMGRAGEDDDGRFSPWLPTSAGLHCALGVWPDESVLNLHVLDHDGAFLLGLRTAIPMIKHGIHMYGERGLIQTEAWCIARTPRQIITGRRIPEIQWPFDLHACAHFPYLLPYDVRLASTCWPQVSILKVWGGRVPHRVFYLFIFHSFPESICSWEQSQNLDFQENCGDSSHILLSSDEYLQGQNYKSQPIWTKWRKCPTFSHVNLNWRLEQENRLWSPWERDLAHFVGRFARAISHWVCRCFLGCRAISFSLSWPDFWFGITLYGGLMSVLYHRR